MAITRRKLLFSATALAGTSVLPLKAGLLHAAAQQPQTVTDATAEAVSLSDFEPLARQRMSHMAYEFLASGAGDEITLRWNREALDKIRLRPRVLVDVSKLNTRVTLFGQELPFPILLAPTALHRLYHPEGELATARGASASEAT